MDAARAPEVPVFAILNQTRATQAQVNAFGGSQFQLTQQVMTRFAEAVERGNLFFTTENTEDTGARRMKASPDLDPNPSFLIRLCALCVLCG